MADRFHHENLAVYQKAIAFVAFAHDLLQAVSAKAAVKDQLKRAGESIPVNIAGSNAQRNTEEQKRLVEIAVGSTAECAACVDVLRTKELCSTDCSNAGKAQLLEIYRMLSGLWLSKENVLREESPHYGDSGFGHEQLEAYRSSLDTVRWMNRFRLRADLDAPSKDSLDRTTTSVVLNIAEGNVKRSEKERGKYFDTAISAALRAASSLDVLVARRLAEDIVEGKGLLARVVSMLLGMQKRAGSE